MVFLAQPVTLNVLTFKARRNKKEKIKKKNHATPTSSVILYAQRLGCYRNLALSIFSKSIVRTYVLRISNLQQDSSIFYFALNDL